MHLNYGLYHIWDKDKPIAQQFLSCLDLIRFSPKQILKAPFTKALSTFKVHSFILTTAHTS